MKKFWIKRELPWRGYDYDDYLVSGIKKRLLANNEELEDDSFCASMFEKLTGLKLKPGEIVQCELKVIKKG